MTFQKKAWPSKKKKAPDPVPASESASNVPGDSLTKPALFITNDPNKKVKIPAFRFGETWLKTPRFAVFSNLRFETKSKYVAGVLRRTLGVLEAPGS